MTSRWVTGLWTVRTGGYSGSSGGCASTSTSTRLLSCSSVSTTLCVMSAVVGLIWFVPGGLAQDPADISLLSILATQAPVLVLSLLLEYLGFVIMIAALASAYAQLSGWGGPRAEILERFE